MDTKARNLSNDNIETLKDLASTAEIELAAVKLATLDELTKIHNRRGFMMLSQHSLNLCMRQEIPATLVYIDINNFKQINDTFGHAEGDKVLRTFASLISTASRESDIFARMGGDEFVILFTNTTANAAKNNIIRLQLSLDKQNANNKYDITFSYGIVVFDPNKHKTTKALLEDGDSQMYQHKNM